MPNVRWGICATGGIAHAFAKDLALVENAELVAVGSRRKEEAERFGREFNLPHRHGSYEELASNPDVDVVYVATPHAYHYENALLFLNAGKGVLVEKPFSINAKQAQEMIAAAHANKVFLMEAQWTHFLPGMREMKRMISEGLIGEVKMLDAAFCFNAPFDPKSRMYDPTLGGGALLDVGVYPLMWGEIIMGLPQEVKSFWAPTPTGVDGQNALLCRYASGAIGQYTTAVHAARPVEALVVGTKGWIKLVEPFFKAETLLVKLGDNEAKSYRFPLKGNGFEHEAAEVTRCILEGKTESAVVTHKMILDQMTLLDQIRAEWGLTYPMEA